MARTKKVRYSGVGLRANGYLLSRVQNLSVEADLGEEEARELTNSEVVEYTATNPQTSISFETNEYGSCRNIRAIVGITGGAASDIVNVNSFDGSVCDIGVGIEEDNTLTRTLLINNAFPTSVSFNYDVGGVATESYDMESDNLSVFANTYKNAYSIMGIFGTAAQHATNGSGNVTLPLLDAELDVYMPIRQYIDGISVTGAVTFYTDGTNLHTMWTDTNFTETGLNYRTFITNTGSTLGAIEKTTSTSSIGSIPRGKMNIILDSGTGTSTYSDSTNFLRLQSLSADIDLAREELNELGHYRAYDRSLTLPVNVNMTFSTLANDMTEWAKLSDTGTNINEYTITNFAKTAKLIVGIYDKQDTDSTRSLLKTLTISGIQVTNISFGVDVGGNATQDFTARASNFVVSGTGTPGLHPITATPTD